MKKMRGRIERLSVCGRLLSVYLPPAGRKEAVPAAYLQDGEMVEQMREELVGRIEKAVENGKCRPFMLVGVYSPCRDAEYTPWPAPSAFSRGEAYPGQAGQYLKILENEIKPQIDSRYPTLPGPVETALCGYSLGGLCALYAAFSCGTFGRIASVCGSLWYPGWIEFVREGRPVGELSALWISLGKKEVKPTHPLLSKTGAAALQTDALLAPFAQRKSLVWHEGGHFTGAAQRMAQALCWLFLKEESDEGL